MIVPPAIALWPATPAWAVLFVLLAVAIGWVAWRSWRRWRSNAYRREALRSLPGATPAEIAAVLKRTALAAWPRETVASLAGPGWAAFLRRTAPDARLNEATALALADLAYGSVMPDARDAAARWIRCHDVRR